ncbi:Camk protein kinase, partial [Globisporangium splendens]
MACISSYAAPSPPTSSNKRVNPFARFRVTADIPPPPVRKNPYRVIKELGSGLQGRVVLAHDDVEQKYVAVKIPSAFGSSSDGEEFDARLLNYQVQSILQERRAHRQVVHHNVLEYKRLVPGKKRDIHYSAMVMEYAPNGDFFDIIADTGALPEDIAKFYFFQLMSGIQACHASGVIHRDIKPENMLLDQNFTLKICDFGLAHVAPRPSRNADKVILRDVSGTALYMAPEIHSGKPYRATPVDVWSAGVVLFILLTSFPPFMNAKKGDCWYDCIVSGQMDVFWSAQKECADLLSSDARDLISKVLCADPEARLTVDQVLQHPWLKDALLVDRTRVFRDMAARRQFSLSCPKDGKQH